MVVSWLNPSDCGISSSYGKTFQLRYHLSILDAITDSKKLHIYFDPHILDHNLKSKSIFLI